MLRMEFGGRVKTLPYRERGTVFPLGIGFAENPYNVLHGGTKVPPYDLMGIGELTIDFPGEE